MVAAAALRLVLCYGKINTITLGYSLELLNTFITNKHAGHALVLTDKLFYRLLSTISLWPHHLFMTFVTDICPDCSYYSPP